MSKKKGLGKFLLGAGIGAGLGLLFAPKKGSETRADLKATLDELAKKVKEIDVEEVKDNLEERIEEIKTGLAELDKEKVLSIAKKKGNELKKKSEELVNSAVERGTPVVQKAADDIRKKTIVVVKEVLAKLEKEEK